MNLPGESLVSGAFSLLQKGLDVIFPDPAQKAQAEALLIKAQADGKLQELDAGLRQEMERTTRHANDMKSDSWLSKNIRPGALIYLLLAFTVLALSDGNLSWNEWSFSVETVYVKAIIEFLKIVLGFYFVGRSVEKAIKIFKGENDAR